MIVFDADVVVVATIAFVVVVVVVLVVVLVAPLRDCIQLQSFLCSQQVHF